jgi:hypothetical protein
LRIEAPQAFGTGQGDGVNVVAQGDSDSIGCRILVDGQVKAERISNEVNAFTYCRVNGA